MRRAKEADLGSKGGGLEYSAPKGVRKAMKAQNSARSGSVGREESLFN